MATFNENEYIIGTADYRSHFWNAMRLAPHDYAVLNQADGGKHKEDHLIPLQDAVQMDSFIGQESVLRSLATVVKFYGGASSIFAHDCADFAGWVPEGGAIPMYDGIEDFAPYPVDSHKLAVFVRLTEDFVHDSSFDIKEYLTRRIAKNFAKAEDDAFLNGTGETEPVGILSADRGAEIGASTKSLSFDDIIKLYASVKPEYRANGTWLMNDDTLLALRTLKDSNGAYIWNSDKDTILGKPVVISESMPNAEKGKLPVLFGDFSYYWIILRSPVRMRTLSEKFVLYNQVGYLAFSFLDGRLLRREAVKALKISV